MTDPTSGMTPPENSSEQTPPASVPVAPVEDVTTGEAAPLAADAGLAAQAPHKPARTESPLNASQRFAAVVSGEFDAEEEAP
jgi:hypothetical protein